MGEENTASPEVRRRIRVRKKRRRTPAWRKSRTWCLAGIAVIGLTLGIVGAQRYHQHQLDERARELALARQRMAALQEPPIMSVNRPYYPFSIIAGGVYTAGELREAIHRDPVVAEHYANFDVDRLHFEPALKDEMVYVSYRLANQVFWTKRPLQIKKGEMLVTDGVHRARTRCGNQLAVTPQYRVAIIEPPPHVLEEAEMETPPELPSTMAELYYPVEMPPYVAPPVVASQIAAPAEVLPPLFVPPTQILPQNVVLTPPGQAPSAVPEPATLSLMGLGFAALSAKLWRSRRTRRAS